MLLSLVLHMYSLRCVLPAAVLLGTAPTYVLAWGAWRLLSALLPARFYQAVDDRLYCVYQSMVLFFFENYTGVQVSHCAPLPPLATGAPRGAGATPARNQPAPPGPSGGSSLRGRRARAVAHPPGAGKFQILTLGLAQCLLAETPGSVGSWSSLALSCQWGPRPSCCAPATQSVGQREVGQAVGGWGVFREKVVMCKLRSAL